MTTTADQIDPPREAEMWALRAEKNEDREGARTQMGVSIMFSLMAITDGLAGIEDRLSEIRDRLSS